jgi:hypothetical protein
LSPETGIWETSLLVSGDGWENQRVESTDFIRTLPSAPEAVISNFTRSLSGFTEVVLNRVLVFSQPSAPGPFNLGHTALDKLERGIAEVGIVLEQMGSISEVFHMKQGFPFREAFLDLGKRVHAQASMAPCILDLLVLV